MMSMLNTDDGKKYFDDTFNGGIMEKYISVYMMVLLFSLNLNLTPKKKKINVNKFLKRICVLRNWDDEWYTKIDGNNKPMPCAAN